MWTEGVLEVERYVWVFKTWKQEWDKVMIVSTQAEGLKGYGDGLTEVLHRDPESKRGGFTGKGVFGDVAEKPSCKLLGPMNDVFMQDNAPVHTWILPGWWMELVRRSWTGPHIHPV